MRAIILFLLALPSLIINSQETTTKNDTTEKAKTGWSFGALPVIAFSSDIGMKYGGLANFYDFGTGEQYPDYRHSIYFELTNTTRGSLLCQLQYDSKYLIPGIRVSASAVYNNEQALDFYGFNGYNSYYNENFSNKGESEYITGVFYRHARRLLRAGIDVMGNIADSKLKWLSGIGIYDFSIGSVDINTLNKGRSASEKLPSLIDKPGLFEKFMEWGFITLEEKKGGTIGILKAGFVYDTRNNEPNPDNGMWDEIFLQFAPVFTQKSLYTQLLATHRQYFTIVPKRLSFAYRLGIQQKLSGTLPFYMLPYIFRSNKPPMYGMGGYCTIRGSLRNRVVGDGIFYGNAEFRYKVYKTNVFNNNFYVAVSSFTDFGTVITKHNMESDNPEALSFLSKGSNEGFHPTLGGGVHFALNENFIVAVDYGRSLNKQDGKDGLYIDLDFLF